MTTCKTCIPIECDNERYDVYSLQDSLFLVLRLQGCLSTVQRMVPVTATAADIEAAKAAIEAEVLRQNALCYPEPEDDPTTPLRLSVVPPCCCVGTPLNVDISVSGGEPPYVYKIIEGALPDGLTLGTGTLSGTPTTGGAATFTVKVWDAKGQTAQAQYTINALNITSTSCPPFQVGVPYSHYLQAIGGSGNYMFKLLTGELPDGIVLDTSGWLHGTPTGANGTSTTCTFSCIDTDCQDGDRSFYIPRVTLSTVSTHTNARIIGYEAFDRSLRRFRMATYFGTSSQTANSIINGGQDENGPLVASARYEWLGSSAINGSGTIISTHIKNFFAPCSGGDEPTIYYQIGTGTADLAFVPNTFGVAGYPQSLKGYCFAADGTSCTPCADPIVLISNVATNGATDVSDLLSYGLTPVVTPTTYVVNGSAYARVALSPSKPLEYTYYDGYGWPLIYVAATHDYSITLSDEYTESDALSNAEVYASNGNTALYLPFGGGLTYSRVDVTYVLNFSNLVEGENYTASVRFKNKLKQTSYRTYTFTATAKTHTITDTIPTPAPNDTITVDAPRVAYV